VARLDQYVPASRALFVVATPVQHLQSAQHIALQLESVMLGLASVSELCMKQKKSNVLL